MLKKTVFGIMLTFFLLSMLPLTFNMQPAKASGTIYIRVDGSIDPPDAPISTVDYVTYTLTGSITSDADGIVIERGNVIIDGNEYMVQGSEEGFIGFNLTSVSNVAIKNTHIKGFFTGVLICSSQNNIVGENNITNNDFGIGLYSSSNNTISGNSITVCSYGIQIRDSSNYNSIIKNNITANSFDGIYVDESSNNSISGNNIANYLVGIHLCSSSNNNSISGNNITAHLIDGIDLADSSNNRIVRNNIGANGVGLTFGYSSNNSISENNITANVFGAYLMWHSSNNLFYHNSFTDNTHQVSTSDSLNVWDDGYPSGGNYWSDYISIDSNFDGIGDTQYVIDSNNTDNYPLMGPFSDFTATPEYSVQTICNSTISSFQFNGTAIIFNVSGEIGTSGFCRICIPTTLINGPYHVLINGTEVSCSLLPCSNSTHNYLYFTYDLSTKEVIIIPEFPSTMVLPLFILVTSIATILLKRKKSKIPIC